MEFLTYLKEYKIRYLEKNGTIFVPENLWLCNSKITKLPNNLFVEKWLDLRYTPITKLPNNLFVGESLYLNVEKITNIAYRKNCEKFNGTLFAAYVNGEIQIAAGRFLGNIKKFDSAVDEKCLGIDAKNYKQAARECIRELEQIRNR